MAEGLQSEGPPSPTDAVHGQRFDLSNVRLAIGLPVRNVAKFLPTLVDQLTAAAAACRDVRIVIAENDSADDTEAIASAIAQASPVIRLLRFPGLAQLLPERTDRLAFLRNSIVEELLATTDGGGGWTAVFLDADDVTSSMTCGDVLTLVRFLHEHPEYSAATANSHPVYYDTWTLRCEGWSPDDCWTRVAARSASMSYEDAVRLYVAERQVPIDPDLEPIAVRSAFGGLAAYRLNELKSSRYRGRNESGEICSDHVPMHQELVAHTGRQLAIVPNVLMTAPPEHLAAMNLEASTASSRRPVAPSTRVASDLRRLGRRLRRVRRSQAQPELKMPAEALRLNQVDEFALWMSPRHTLPGSSQQFRAFARPVRSIAVALRQSYGRRIKAIDIGAGIGDTATLLAIVAGAEVLAIEGDPENLAALERNVAPLADRVTVFHSYVTAAASSASGHQRLAGRTHLGGPSDGESKLHTPGSHALADVLSHHGWEDADFFKTDTDGLDFELISSALDLPWHQPPVVFFGFDPALDPGGADAGLSVIERALTRGYRRLYVWDNFGNLLGLVDHSHLSRIQELCSYLSRCREAGGGVTSLTVAGLCDHHPAFTGEVELRPAPS